MAPPGHEQITVVFYIFIFRPHHVRKLAFLYMHAASRFEGYCQRLHFYSHCTGWLHIQQAHINDFGREIEHLVLHNNLSFSLPSFNSVLYGGYW